MRVFRLLPILLVLIIGGIYFTFGPSFLLGGPKNSDIVAATRTTMIATSPDAATAEVAKSATISPKGLCNNQGEGVYACLVEVTVTGVRTSSFVSVLRKDRDGNWATQQ